MLVLSYSIVIQSSNSVCWSTWSLVVAVCVPSGCWQIINIMTFSVSTVLSAVIKYQPGYTVPFQLCTIAGDSKMS